MRVTETSQVRNVALAGHTQTGKTSLAEAIIWTLKQTDHLGKIEDGNTVSDYDPEEIRRHASIQTSLVAVEYEDFRVNLLDTPGYRDFIGEIKQGIRVAESVVLVADATGGLDTGTESAVDIATEYENPVILFINKMDKESASFEKSLGGITGGLELRTVPLTLPVGEASGFKGVIDLIRMKYVQEDGQKVSYSDIPSEQSGAVETARAELIEIAAEGDEALLEKFLEEETLSPDEILSGLKNGFEERRFVPVFCGSATALKGIRPLVEFVHSCSSDPGSSTSFQFEPEEGAQPDIIRIKPEGEALIYIFKTAVDPYAGKRSYFKVLQGTMVSDTVLSNLTRNCDEKAGHLLVCSGNKSFDVGKIAAGDIGVMAKLDNVKTGDTLAVSGSPSSLVSQPRLPKPTAFMSVHARSRADEDKVGMGFHRLIEQDTTLNVSRDASISQTIMSGMGDLHLQVAVARLKDLAKVEVDLEVPRVPYRETITRSAEGQGKHKKQSGGHGQYGDCWIRFEPLPEGSGFEFVWEIVGGAIPTNYKSAVEKGLVESLERGVISGHTTVDVKATCYDGTYHAVDSSDMAFKVAASLAFKNIIPNCGPIILEPIYKATITVPEDYTGDIMGDLNGRRGRILGMNPIGRKQVVEAHVPLSELYTYGRQLNSISQGRGVWEMEFDHYDRVPSDVQEKIIQSCKQDKEAELAAH